MPITPERWEAIKVSLETARPVRTRKMFGGVGLYLDDAFFGLVDDDRVYFKVDDTTAPLYEAQGMGPWAPGFAAAPNLKYRELPPSVLEDADLLGEWIDESVRVARETAKPSRARPKR